MKTLLTNCKIVNHDKTFTKNILIGDGIIKSITDETPAADKTYDLKGKMVLPGLIDMHVHFRDPGLEYKEDILSGSLAAVAGGVTAVCPMANTKPVNDNSFITKYMADKGREIGICDIFPVGAVSKGMKCEELTEFGEMVAAGACAFSDDGKPVLGSEIMRRALEYSSGFGKMILSHSEDHELAGQGVIHEGEASAITGLRGIPSETEEIMIARDILLAKLTGGHVHICHISSRYGVELVRWGKSKGINVTCEVTPHHFTLTDKELLTYDTNYKMNPPLRTADDVLAMKEGLVDGTIDCIATDHAPHSKDEKFQEFDLAPFGITGLQTLVPLTLNLMREGLINENDFSRLCSYAPAKLLGLNDRGEIKEGLIADIAVIDPDKEYVFNTKLNKSKSINSPFLGKTLKGLCVQTFKNGKEVYELEE